MKRISKIMLVALFALLSVAFGVQAAFAAEIIVSTNADGAASNNGACTLREAITNANNNNQSGSTDCVAGSGADTIVFTPTLTSSGDAIITLTIFDTGVDSTEFGPTALYISSPITIKGPTGSNGVIIQRNSADTNKFRLFHVTSAGNLTLENLTLKNGLAQGGNGASGDWTTSRAGSGGGAAGLGGAIYNEGTLSVRSSTLSGNGAVGGNGGSQAGTLLVGGGGGVGANGTNTNGGGPNGGTVNCAAAPGNGGGGGSRNTIDGNGCNGGFGGGGGGASATVTSGIQSRTGGAGGFGGGGGGGAKRNSAGIATGGTGGFGAGNGGADSTPTGSSGSGGGGGLGAGGAIANISGTVTISNSTFSGNSATGGNGGSGTSSGSGGAGYGGAIFGLDGSITILNSTAASNSVSSGTGGTPVTSTGGGLYHYRSAGTVNLTLQNSIFADTPSARADATINGTVNVSGLKSNIVETNSGVPTAQIITLNGDPSLSALADNGGPTLTHAIPTTSNAYDSGDATSCSSYDQRGIPRPINLTTLNCDIGAYEYEDTTKINSSFAGAITGKSFASTPDSTYPAYSAQGITTLTTRFTNTTVITNVTNVYLKVSTVTSGKYVLDANGGPGQAGAVQYLDAELTPGEGASATFRIGHALVKGNFALLVDVWGKAQAASASAERADIYLGTIEFRVEEGEADPHTIFLPVIGR